MYAWGVQNQKEATMTTNANNNDAGDLLDTLQIKKTTRRYSVGGTWVTGTIADHYFEALVFPEHAECESYELGDSRISKLYMRRSADRQTVANFDRGWDIQPTNDLARQLVDLLAAGLAEFIFGK